MKYIYQSNNVMLLIFYWINYFILFLFNRKLCTQCFSNIYEKFSNLNLYHNKLKSHIEFYCHSNLKIKIIKNILFTHVAHLIILKQKKTKKIK